MGDGRLVEVFLTAEGRHQEEAHHMADLGVQRYEKAD